jgi:dTDP-4-dehydrorhamnose reductase
MRILVAGAGGMLGRDVARAAEAAGHEVLAAERSELDVTDAPAVEALLDDARPEAVVNCAAYTDVDGAEEHAGEALLVNAEGAGNVARAAARLGAAVAYISTDYVFDGTKAEPWVESDQPRPLSSYGRSKLAGERATAEGNPRHLIVRTSWLFGVGGRNFVETMLGLGLSRDEVRVVDDQAGCPTYTVHLAGGLLRLVADEARGVHHVAGDGSCTWYDFAREIFTQAGIRCRVLPCGTSDLPRPAPRPEYSVLRSERTDAVHLPHWRVGLEGYLAERAVRA